MFRYFFYISLIILNLIISFPQETDETKNEPINLRNLSISGSRGYQGAFSKVNNILDQGLARNLRYTVHDGNLVSGGVINTGLLAYHYVSGSPTMSWPKGSLSVQYLHGAVFYVGAEVVDESGDTIHIISDNYRRGGEVSLDQSHFYAFGPVPKYFNGNQPNALTYDIGGISEDVGIDTYPNTFDEGEGDGLLQFQEDFNSNGFLDVNMINNTGWFAISHRKETWPTDWPVGSFPGDDRIEGDGRQSVRIGRWNGEYGSYARADQESYYAIDDRENDEFDYYPFDDEESRLPWPNGRRGLGLTTSVRTYQWSARLAEDLIISICDIENKGRDLEKCVVGMYVDPDIGGSLSGDDATFDNLDDITYAFNLVGLSSNGLPIGYFGFAFLESPGLANDGIDNDEDGRVDESQNNGIDDDNDWKIFEDKNGNGIWDNEDINNNGVLDAGEDLNSNGLLDIEPLNDDLGSDGLGPDFNEYTGPDPNGTQGNGIKDNGEPNFEFTDNDESDQVGLTSFYLRDVDNTMANDELYWNTEVFPGTYTVRPGYQRDIAWSYGSGFVKFAGAEKKHRYAISLLFGNNEADILRNKKTMQVIYNEDYNFAKPPLLPVVKAIGGDKKVILSWDDSAERSKDPIYGEDFEAYYIYKSTDPTFTDIKTITDAYSNPLLFKPLAIFDINNGLKGIHPVSIGSEINQESDLGVSYNMGTDSGLKHFFVDNDVVNGRTYYYAVVSVDRGYIDYFYPTLTDKEGLLTISPTECSANIQTDLLGRAIGTDKNTVIVTPVEHPAGWEFPSLKDDMIVHFDGVGTGSINVEIFDENSIKSDKEYSVKFYDDGEFEQYGTNYTGVTNRATLFNETDGLAIFSLTDPDTNPLADEFIADGIKISITNDVIDLDTAYWTQGNSTLQLISTTKEDNGVLLPTDYEIRVLEMGADSSVNSTPIPTNFQVWDVTDQANQYQVNFRYVNSSQPDSLIGILSDGDKIQIVSDYSNTKRLWIFKVDHPDSLPVNQRINPVSGDILKTVSTKSFDRKDNFTFSFNGNAVNISKEQDELSNIYVVPDPYLVSSSLERKVINEAEGRGDRRIDFVNLPNSCSISIFTTAGRFVRKLEHYSETSFSREIWDLRTKDGLEIAPGIYFYVVETPTGGTKTGRFAIIK